MEKFKKEHPDYFKILEKSPKEPRQPATIYRDEHMVEYSKANPKVCTCTICMLTKIASFATASKKQTISLT